MALQMTGSDVALQRTASGRYDLVFSASGKNKGNPVLESTGTHAVLSTLLSQKRGTRPGSQAQEGGYYYDAQNRRGTLIWTITQDRMGTPSQLEAYAQDGGQQLLDMKLIGSFSAKAQRIRPGSFRLSVAWTLPSGTSVPPLSISLG